MKTQLLRFDGAVERDSAIQAWIKGMHETRDIKKLLPNVPAINAVRNRLDSSSPTSRSFSRARLRPL
jgi:hypothetical protein